MKPINLNEEQTRCLEGLAETTRPDGEMCVPFNVIEAETDYPRALVRRQIRALARKGLAEYFRGLWNDDGEPRGAGYCITRAGEELVKSWKGLEKQDD